ncbi:uncharacterized protein LOC144107785 [Amblyomma americanum]
MGYAAAAGPNQPRQAAPCQPRSVVPRAAAPAQTGGGGGHAGGTQELFQTPSVQGEFGDITPEDFESTLNEERTLFFERKVAIFQVWQLFIVWMALTGLLVFVGSLIAFHHTLIQYDSSSTVLHTHVFDHFEPGEVNGTCDDYTPCRAEALCVNGRCSCQPPDFHVVAGVCESASTTKAAAAPKER